MLAGLELTEFDYKYGNGMIIKNDKVGWEETIIDWGKRFLIGRNDY